jgi:hypothetical protein
VAGQLEIRVYSVSDHGVGFRPVDSELADVYFLQLSLHNGRQPVN